MIYFTQVDTRLYGIINIMYKKNLSLNSTGFELKVSRFRL